MDQRRLPPDDLVRLRTLVDVFLAENANINLSAHRTPEACWEANVLDSLAFLDIAPKLSPIMTIIDVGTGGGFPLLPLAMLLPDVRCTGIDSTKKKVDAIGRIVKALNLPNVSLTAGRAEDLGRDPAQRERYDIVTARAVAALPTLLEYCAPFARPGGSIVLWKSEKIDDELKASTEAQRILQCPLASQWHYTLGNRGARQLLIFRKIGHLRPLYPRGRGLPGTKPL